MIPSANVYEIKFQLYSFQLDEVEYALPASEAPTLAEVLSTEEEDVKNKVTKYIEDPAACSALQVEFLQGVSQQLLQAQVCIVKLCLILCCMACYWPSYTGCPETQLASKYGVIS